MKEVLAFSLTGTAESEKQVAAINKQLQQTDVSLNKIDKDSAKAFTDFAKNVQKSGNELKRINVDAVKTAEAGKKIGEGFQGALSNINTVATALGGNNEALQAFIGQASGLASVFDKAKKTAEGFNKENIGIFKNMVKGWQDSAAGATLFGVSARAALIATGIGALVVALGTIIVYWDDIAVAIGLATDEQKKLVEETERYFAIIQRNADMTFDVLSRELENELKLARARKASIDEITNLEVKLAQLRATYAKEQSRNYRQSTEAQIELLKSQIAETSNSEERKKKEQELNDIYAKREKLRLDAIDREKDITVAVTARAQALKDEADKNAKEAKAEADARAAAEKQAQRTLAEIRAQFREEGFAKEREAINRHYSQLIEDIKANEKISESLKTEIRLEYERNRVTQLGEINRKERLANIQKDAEANLKSAGAAGVAGIDVKKAANQMAAALEARNKALADAQAKTPPVRSFTDILLGLNPDGTEDENQEDIAEGLKNIFSTAFDIYMAATDAFVAAAEERIQSLQDQLNNVNEEYDAAVNNIDASREELAKADGDRHARLSAQVEQEQKQAVELANQKMKIERQLENERKKIAKQRKAADIAMAIGNTAVAVVKAYKDTPGPPWIGIAMAALIGALGLVQINSIRKQQYYDGGAVGGYTGAGGKYEPAGTVHKGEVVWNQRDVALAGGPMAVDRMRPTYKGYAVGGVVGDSYTPLVNASSNSDIRNLPPSIVYVDDINMKNQKNNARKVRASI